jgi:chromate reductase
MKMLGLNGSLRPGSYNGQLLEAAAPLLPAGVEFEMFDGLRDLPPYREIPAGDGDGAVPSAVTALRQAIGAADAVLISTPEYNGSIPGQLKNALDWASRPFPGNCLRNKPTAVVGASTGLFGAVWAQAELRKVLGVIGASVIDADLPVGQAHEAFGLDGRLADPDKQTAFAELIAQLLATVSPPVEVVANSAGAVSRTLLAATSSCR